jgi:hypothetical protein
MKVYDTETTFGTNAEGLFRERSQVIPQDFLDSLKSERDAKAAVRAGELERTTSVPTQVYEIWMAQGRDPWRAPQREIIKWLKAEGLEAFIATPKRV